MKKKVKLYLYDLNQSKLTTNKHLYSKEKVIYLVKMNWRINKNLEIYLHKKGKPHFCYRNINFNISYSENFMLIGLSNIKIGVDIEAITTFNINVVKKFFTENEKEYIYNANNKELFNINCYKIWTQKEAYVKCTGQGINKSFKLIDTISLQNKVILKSFKNGLFIISYCLKPYKNFDYNYEFKIM